MPEKVFVSHSREDEDLVNRIDRALKIVDYDTLVYEWEEVGDHVEDDEEIIRKMRECSACFVFPTPTVQGRSVTPAWLIAESTIARVQNTPTVVFKEEGDDYEINFPYFHALVVYNREELALEIQERMQALSQVGGESAAGAVTGGLAAAAVVGTGGAALLGGLLGAALADEEDGTAPTVRCPECNKSFAYWGTPSSFNCPHCHTPMNEDEHETAAE
ncbi:toll/interleukin-1 receptor domain-containing protein [Halobacterium salinarum]|uniref:toll/interleukin-1 receptor domain-containing protein n=1 Tax=Halobacterium salinarum TaxID=2242 RepID=UPI001F363606|nr:toll/interleukin-1 receptor domain-containing protein [Halobacterium salinarum]MCF2166220.1 toll/interleukin-1 receptor domain-containing protein [Halobacterium salinarum]MCF2167703.1 toll/interleukin-1 receptor domain-containing protein [Halobacterium salinarum]